MAPSSKWHAFSFILQALNFLNSQNEIPGKFLHILIYTHFLNVEANIPATEISNPALYFYFPSRDPKITHLLLQAQYPVLGVDCYMPVVDVFSGSCNGHLRVVLAMGRSEQIISLQRTRDEEYDRLPHLLRPVHLLDHQPHSNTKVCVHVCDTKCKSFCECIIIKVKQHLPALFIEKI